MGESFQNRDYIHHSCESEPPRDEPPKGLRDEEIPCESGFWVRDLVMRGTESLIVGRVKSNFHSHLTSDLSGRSFSH